MPPAFTIEPTDEPGIVRITRPDGTTLTVRRGTQYSERLTSNGNGTSSTGDGPPLTANGSNLNRVKELATVPADPAPEPSSGPAGSSDPLASPLANLEQLSLLTSDPAWSSLFAFIAASAGADVALYCAYCFLGWPDLEAYRMVRGNDSGLKRIPEPFRMKAAPEMAKVVARLMPSRLWIFGRVREFVDNEQLGGEIRAGLLRMMAQHYMEAERVAAIRAAATDQQQELNYAQTAYGNGEAARILGNSLNEAILSRGATIIVPGKGSVGEEAESAVDGEARELPDGETALVEAYPDEPL